MTQTSKPSDQDGPEAGATEEAVALHGDQATAEQYAQPQTVNLDAATGIAVPEDDGNPTPAR